MMIFLGYPDGVKGYLFMRLHNNSLFTAATALFDERLMPKCKTREEHDFMPITGGPLEEVYPPTPSMEDGEDEGLIPQPHSPLPPSEIEVQSEPSSDVAPGQVQDPPIAPPSEHGDEPPAEPPVAEIPVRRSGRERRVPVKPGNIYGEQRNPTEIQRDDRRRALRPEPEDAGRSQLPEAPEHKKLVTGTNSAQVSKGHGYSDASLDVPEELVAKLAQEGGVDFMRYLLAQALPDANDLLPSPSKPVRDWTFRDIMRMPQLQQKEWKNACHEELEALRKRKVFELVQLPHGRKAIRNRWVFNIKTDGRKKARLVAKGFSQVEGIDFDEIFSPVVRFESVRFMLALSALEGWTISALDVKSAFLYGKLDEEIYMEQPEGFKVKGQETKVLRLRRAIYGLKQAALAWWRELAASLKELGFIRFSSDAGIFICRLADGSFVIIVAYVDDIMFIGPNNGLIASKKRDFMVRWDCRDLGECKEFLRMRIIRNQNRILLDQSSYLDKVVERFGMKNAKFAQTPLPAGYTPKENKLAVNATLRTEYQQVIGSLLYIMLGTRPDIAFAVTKMAQFAANPSKEHLDKAKYIVRYLASTPKYALVLDGASNKGLIAYSDSDYAGDPIKRRSQTGYFFKLANGAISWQSRAQKTVALSSTEAEYMALSDCSHQAVWMQQLYSELGLTQRPTPICADNQGSIFIGSNPVQERRTKHIDVRYHYIRECVEDGKVELFWVPTDENPADMFTKNLGHVKFLQFRSMLGLEFYSP